MPKAKRREEVTLCDTGPLVALIDGNDPDHATCAITLRERLPKVPLVTTVACYTEAMYFLGKEIGPRGQQALWQWRRAGRLRLHHSSDAEFDRMDQLMAEYQDTPMDFADASIVAAAEALSLTKVFTLDRHFYAYRMAGGQALEVIR